MGHLADHSLPEGTDIATFGDPRSEGQFILFSKGNPNRRMLDLGIQRMRQSGVLDVILKKWIGKQLRLAQSQLNSTSEVGGSQVALGFIMLVFAYVVTSIVLAVEKAWKMTVDVKQKDARKTRAEELYLESV